MICDKTTCLNNLLDEDDERYDDKSRKMTGFHFTKDPPPDSLFTDFGALNRFNNEQFEQLITIAFSFIADTSKGSKLMEQLEDFASENGVNPGSLKSVFKSLLIVPNAALKNNLGPEQIQEDLLALGLNSEKALHFSQQWKTHSGTLSRGALGQTLVVNQLVDMDWKFGGVSVNLFAVTAASSEMNKVGSTFLQLKMDIKKGNGIESTYMELTLPQFYSFLHEMEKAKASLEYLT